MLSRIPSLLSFSNGHSHSLLTKNYSAGMPYLLHNLNLVMHPKNSAVSAQRHSEAQSCHRMDPRQKYHSRRRKPRSEKLSTWVHICVHWIQPLYFHLSPPTVWSDHLIIECTFPATMVCGVLVNYVKMWGIDTITNLQQSFRACSIIVSKKMRKMVVFEVHNLYVAPSDNHPYKAEDR